ncbi:hypothetical protein F5Y08DRAFT_352814 [Xylaria arbuscula]|nr:hypothetical protein F5Y08DRAFT_352814 [Xylaria arbuscula]
MPVAVLPIEDRVISHVDHRISLTSDDKDDETLVTGIGKPSSMFSTRSVGHNLNDLSEDYRWALKELAHSCYNAETRYGYDFGAEPLPSIQTDEDLVVCRFHGGNDALDVKIQSIPWSAHGAGELTTDLALWYLCMLSMSPTDSRGIPE